MGIVKHPEKGRVLSDIEISVKSKFNGSKKKKNSHFINDLFNNTYDTLPDHLQYKNKYNGTIDEKEAILKWLENTHLIILISGGLYLLLMVPPSDEPDDPDNDITSEAVFDDIFMFTFLTKYL